MRVGVIGLGPVTMEKIKCSMIWGYLASRWVAAGACRPLGCFGGWLTGWPPGNLAAGWQLKSEQKLAKMTLAWLSIAIMSLACTARL